MRNTTRKMNELKEKAYNLYLKGMNNKEIAKTIGVTEKTAGKWLKPFKEQQNQLENTRTLVIDRINKALANPNTTTEDIKNLTYTLSTIRPMLK